VELDFQLEVGFLFRPERLQMERGRMREFFILELGVWRAKQKHDLLMQQQAAQSLSHSKFLGL
jgi:hypothetical protein